MTTLSEQESVKEWGVMIDERDAIIAAQAAKITALLATLKLYETAIDEAEAIFGGEYGDAFGPMFEMAMAARKARAALEMSGGVL